MDRSRQCDGADKLKQCTWPSAGHAPRTTKLTTKNTCEKTISTGVVFSTSF